MAEHLEEQKPHPFPDELGADGGDSARRVVDHLLSALPHALLPRGLGLDTARACVTAWRALLAVVARLVGLHRAPRNSHTELAARMLSEVRGGPVCDCSV